MNMTIKIFISHASADLTAAKEVRTALSSAGFKPWLDEAAIQPGVLLRNQLQQAIAKSKYLVLIWSDTAAQSRWVAAEILTAFHTGRRVVACVLTKEPLPQFLARD